MSARPAPQRTAGAAIAEPSVERAGAGAAPATDPGEVAATDPGDDAVAETLPAGGWSVPTAPPAGVAHAAAAPGRAAFGLYLAHVVGLFGLALSNGLLGLAILASPGARPRRLLQRELRPMLLLVGLYVGLLGVAIATSYDPRHSLGQASELFALGTLLLGMLLVRGEGRARWVLDAVVALAALEAGVGLGQLVMRGGVDLAQRIQGTFSHYMTFAAVLMVADLLLFARLAVRGRGAGWRALLLVPINVALAATLTRSAWVGLVAGLVVLLLLSRRRALLWSLPAALLLFALLPQPVLDRVLSIADPHDATNHDRLCMTRSGAQMIAERPLVGHGPGMVEQRYPLYRIPNATRLTVPHLHNGFLQLAAERGLPALGVMLLLLALPLVRALRSFRREGGLAGARADLHLGILVALVGFVVACQFEDSWGDTEVQRLALLLMALPFGLAAGDDPGTA
jgi:O-antigen ligase